MMKRTVLRGVLLFIVLISSVAAHAGEPMPEPVSRMIAAAAKSGDATALDTVVKTAKAAYPDSTSDIDRFAAVLKSDADVARKAKLAQQRYYQGWKGEGEIGLSRTTGNTDATDVAIGLHLVKEGIRWRHKFDATADSQRSRGVAGTDKYLAAYEANFKLSPVVFTFGLLQWERDRFAGYSNRATEAFGVGYNVIQKPNLSWDVTAGPAFRETDQVAGPSRSEVEARLGTHVSWKISPSTVFTEDGNIYAGGGDNTYQSTTAVTAKIINALAARISFDLKKETSPTVGAKKIDTTSRVTLVYGF